MDCGRSHLITSEGPVEVAAEHVDRIEGEATKVKIAPEEEFEMEVVSDRELAEVDRLNAPAIVRKVLQRDGRTTG